MADTLQRLSTALAGRYTIQRELGAGGMATVYLAEDPRHARPVAVKVLRAELAAMLGAERFLNEIRVTANLQNPHILPLFDSGEADGMLFYVMPYIQGESLREKMDREGSLAVEEAVRIAREVASALEHAHKHNVVHRDIKPENVLLQDGTALVADFGIAIAVSRAGGSRLTETGLSLGTPWYMSPEQAAGERNVDARSDVYSLGAMTYEMLCGEPPHTGATAQAIVAAVLTEQPRDVRMRRPKVPDHVANAVHQALERVPGDRFASAAAFAEALGDARVATTATHAHAPTDALRRATLRGVLAGALATGLIAFFAVRSMGSRAAVASGEDRAQHTFTGRVVRTAISDDGRFLAFVDRQCMSTGIDCRDAIMVQEVGATAPTELLAGQANLTGLRFTHDAGSVVSRGRLNGAAPAVFTMPRLGGPPRTVAPNGPFDTHPSADSIAVAIQDSAGAWIRVIDLTTGRAGDSVRASTGQDIASVSWSPDARFFLLALDDSLLLVARDGRADLVQLLNRGTARWTADGTGVFAFTPGRAREDELMRVDVSGGRFRGPSRVAMARVQTLYLGRFDIARRTGRMVLVMGDAIGDQWIFDLRGGTMTGRAVTSSTTWYGAPDISADGEWLFYQRGNAIGDNVYRMRLSDGSEEALTADRVLGAEQVTVDPAGRELAWERVVTATGANEVAVLDIQSRQLSVESHPGRAWRGDNLALGGGRVVRNVDGQLHVVARDGARTQIPLPDSIPAEGVRLSFDGRSVAFLSFPAGPPRLHAISLDGSALRLVSELRGAYQGSKPSWHNDGHIYMALWMIGESGPSLWRVPATGGRLARVADFPAPCAPWTVVMAAAAPRLACQVRQNRGDVWIIEGAGR